MDQARLEARDCAIGFGIASFVLLAIAYFVYLDSVRFTEAAELSDDQFMKEFLNKKSQINRSAAELFGFIGLMTASVSVGALSGALRKPLKPS